MAWGPFIQKVWTIRITPRFSSTYGLTGLSIESQTPFSAVAASAEPALLHVGHGRAGAAPTARDAARSTAALRAIMGDSGMGLPMGCRWQGKGLSPVTRPWQVIPPQIHHGPAPREHPIARHTHRGRDEVSQPVVDPSPIIRIHPRQEVPQG